MTSGSMDDWTDDQIVDYFRNWAVEYSKWGFNPVQHNRIMDGELTACYELLKRRGDDAVRKLLPLLGNKNLTVRWIAAGFAYEAEPAICRRVLEEVMEERSFDGLMAWATLAGKNPDAIPARHRK